MTAKQVASKIDDRVELAGLRDDPAGLVLYWQVRRPIQPDLSTFIHYFGADGRPLGQEDHGACCEAIYGYRTSEWEPGREIAESFRPAPVGTTYMQIGMYALKDGDIQPYGQTVYLQTQPIALPSSMHPLEVELGEGIGIRGYELTGDGNGWKFTIYWESYTKVKTDYTAFVHLLDNTGKILKQADREPLDNVYPTSAWSGGQTVQDPYELPAVDGAAQIEFGLYDTATGQRLARADGNGNAVVIPIN